MAKPFEPGRLRSRIYLQSRDLASDGMGSMIPAGEFVTRHEVWAELRPMRGSETVIAARLEGRQPFIVTVRRSSATLQVNTAWRIVEKADPNRIHAITAPPSDPTGEREVLEILTVLGRPS